MADFIPFVTSRTAASLATSIYAEATTFRLLAYQAEDLRSSLPQDASFWIDAGFDGFDDLKTRSPDSKGRPSSWYSFFDSIAGFSTIAQQSFQTRPDQKAVNSFVGALLDKCASINPNWITVPFIPFGTGSTRNKINRSLAKATGSWKTKSDYRGFLILPAIFTNQNQINTNRRPRVELISQCYAESRADGLWIVDSSLADDSGSPTLATTRIPALIEFHEELNEAVKSTLRIGGPYWGLNLVLWARGLIDHPAIGLGTGYQYRLSGTQPQSATARLAISPLRRRARVGADLRNWLREALTAIPPGDPSYDPINYMVQNYGQFSDEEVARLHVAKFYRWWLNRIEKHPQTGRALALFQDLTSAFVWGRTVAKGKRLRAEGVGSRPEAVADTFIKFCL